MRDNSKITSTHRWAIRSRATERPIIAMLVSVYL